MNSEPRLTHRLVLKGGHYFIEPYIQTLPLVTQENENNYNKRLQPQNSKRKRIKKIKKISKQFAKRSTTEIRKDDKSDNVIQNNFKEFNNNANEKDPDFKLLLSNSINQEKTKKKKVFSCENCAYKTLYKYNMQRHKLNINH